MISLRLTTIIRALVVLAALLQVAFFYQLSIGTIQYWSPASLVLSEAVCAVLFAVNGSFARKYPLAIFASLTILLFVVSRLLILLWSPVQFLGYAVVWPELFSRTLLFILLGTIGCFAGIVGGYALSGRPRIRPRKPRRYVNPEYLAFAVVGGVVFKLLVYGLLGYIGASGTGEGLGFFQRYVARLVDPYVLMVMFWVGYFLEDKARRRPRHVVIAVSAYMSVLFLTGSRAGVFETGIIFLTVAVYFLGDIKIIARPTVMAAVAAAALIAVVAYPIGDRLRQAQWIDRDTSARSFWNIVTDPDAYGIDYQETVYNISYRMNLIEPAFYVLNATEVGLGDVSELVNAKVSLISSVNRLIPGKPFGDILFSEYAFGFIYNTRGVTSNELGRTDYVGYSWGMYGIAYQLFGFLGGVGFIAIFTGLLTYLCRQTQKQLTFLRACIGSFMVYTFYMWIVNVGLDNLVDRTVHTLAVLVMWAAAWLALSRKETAVRPFPIRAISPAYPHVGR